MKTTKRFFAAAFVALSMSALNACIEEASPVLPEGQDEKLVEMTIEAPSVDVKSTFSGKQIGWELGDKVAVYDGKARREFRVVAVKDGKATLTGLVAAGANDFYAVFPYSAAQDALPSDEGKIYISVPQEQILAEGKSFDEDAFVTTGKIVDNKVTFKNAVSLLKLHVPSGVTSVSLKGFAGENIVGGATATVDAVTDSKAAAVAVTLKPAGETFTEGDYYIALLPVTFNTGFKVIYENAEANDIAIKKNTSKVEFPVNDGHDITAATASLTWIPNPLMSEDDLLYFVGNQAAYAGEAAKLGQDIALTRQWTPVDLKGTLDGQGHIISGLNVNMTGGLGAMCSVENGAALMNVTVEGTITYAANKKNSPAGLVGNLHGTMYNVTNRTTINANSSEDLLYLGGLAGWVHGNGKLINCVNEGTLDLGKVTGSGYIGGIAGVIYSDSGAGLVQDCVNKGVVKSSATSTGGLGGIVGVQESGMTVGCVNKGNVVADAVRSTGGVGGIVGQVYNCANVVTNIHQCDNEGTMTINTSNQMATGGVVGLLSDNAASVEITECVNNSNLSVEVVKKRGTGGMDGFYLGGIVGGINAANTSANANIISSCRNLATVSAVPASSPGTSNAVKVGGICGNTRGLVTLKNNENAGNVTLESTQADGSFCSIGGIVGELGDPWNNEEVNVSVTGNVNNATVLSKTNTNYSAAGGIVGCAFTPVTFNGNKNTGTIERDVINVTNQEVLSACFSGGVVGLFWLSNAGRLNATFTNDMNFGTVKSAGRAGILFGGMYSKSYAQFAMKDCVIGGHLTCGYSDYDLDMTADNWDDKNGTKDGGYIWGYLASGRYGLDPFTPKYGEAASYSGEETLSAWQQGYMDIHHISTGRGNCTFMILPDGTTMMVDAGDNGPDNPKDIKLARVPDESLTPGEWIVRYASHFMDEAGLPARLDYMLLTHFHNDHMGTPVSGYPMSIEGSYYQTGISYVGNNIAVGKLVDRGYPDYDFPFSGAFVGNLMMSNYMKFINDSNNRVEGMAGFEAGSADQFVLKNAPRNDFSIRNIYSNGQIWTGTGSSTKTLVPVDTPQADLDNENLWSNVINISYGDFDYHTGGDILGADLDGTWFANDWRDVETPVALLLKETDVVCCNHHGYDDAMNNIFMSCTTPQACVVPAWEKGHPGEDALNRMATAGSNIFAAGPVTNDSLKSGHVVVRVYEGGSTFQIFVLDDESKDYEVIYQSGIFTSAE